MKMNKTLFVEIINLCLEQQKIDEDIDKSLQKICGSYVCFQTENKMYIALEKLIDHIYGEDDADFIFEWLYAKDHILEFEFDTKKYVVKSPEELYEAVELLF